MFGYVESISEVQYLRPCAGSQGNVKLDLSETTQLLSKSPSKTCKLDPMPSNLVKQCHDVMTVPIMNIFKKCLMDGMPVEIKVAFITPILKKSKSS